MAVSIAPAASTWIPSVQTAVCIGGSERSFPELAHNIVEWLVDVLSQLQSAVAFFGIRPASETWRTLQRVFAFQAVAVQKPCLTNQSLLHDWVMCSDIGRRKCQYFAVQQLCDLALCEGLIRRAETRHGRPFDYILRLRPDLAWELRLNLPPRMQLDETMTIHVPLLEQGARSVSRSVNDKVAIGGRKAMGLYLTRVRHVEKFAASMRLSHNTSRFVSTEAFLARALKLDELRVQPLRRWVYCHVSKRNLMKGAASKADGCIRRWKKGNTCKSLSCVMQDIHYNCKCTVGACGDGEEAMGPAGKAGRFCLNTTGDQLHRRCNWPAETDARPTYQLAGMSFHGSRRHYAPTCNTSSNLLSQLDRAVALYPLK